MIRAGRVIFNEAQVVSVLSDGSSDTTIVTLSSGKVHTFKKYATPVWAHFKGSRSLTTLAAPRRSR